MSKYINAKIYKLINNITDKIYIGSTTKDLNLRLQLHKSPHNPTVSKQLFNNQAIVTIHLLELYPCDNKNELKLKEIHYINVNPSCINKNKPFISNFTTTDIDLINWRRDYRNQHLGKMKAYHSIYKKTIDYKEKSRKYQATYNIKQQTRRLFEALPFHQVLQ